MKTVLQPAETKLRGRLARKVVALSIPLRHEAVGPVGMAVGFQAVVAVLSSHSTVKQAKLVIKGNKR